RTVDRKPAVRNPEYEFGTHDTLDIDTVDDVLHRRQNLSGQLQFAQSQRATLAGRTEPAEEEAEQLPQRIKPEATGHHRVAFEMPREKPQVRLHVEFRADQPPAVLTALFRDF